MRRSLKISLIATFAALHAALYLVSFGLWRNWGIYLAPIEAIILGPWMGFSAAFTGSLAARMIRFDASTWIFGIIAEPSSVMLTGFVVRAKWKPILLAYAVMLIAFFLNPVGASMPLWTVFDILASMVLIIPASAFSTRINQTDFKSLTTVIILLSFICVATDSLTRIFMLVPCGLYNLFAVNADALYALFVSGAAQSYIEDAVAVTVAVAVNVPVIKALARFRESDKRRVHWDILQSNS